MKPCMKLIRVSFITSKKELSQLTFVETLHHFQQSNKIIPLVQDTLAFRNPPKKFFNAKLFALTIVPIVFVVSAYIYFIFFPLFLSAKLGTELVSVNNQIFRSL